MVVEVYMLPERSLKGSRMVRYTLGLLSYVFRNVLTLSRARPSIALGPQPEILRASVFCLHNSFVCLLKPLVVPEFVQFSRLSLL